MTVLHIFTDFILTLCVLLTILPPLLLTSTVIIAGKKCWARFVKWRFPKYSIVSSNSVQSIMDNSRNQGIQTLMVQGGKTLVAEGIRQHLLHLISKKSLLRSRLTSKYGLYAWRYLDDFTIDNYVVEASSHFRGRPITEANIQEYVSRVISKYLPSSQSPWQVYLIKSSSINKSYCVIRAHHLLLHEEQLVLADFLPLQYETNTWACHKTDSPFTNLYTLPVALPILHQKLTESFSNYWNEFVSDNDPIERPEILKKDIGIFQFIKILIIVFVLSLKKLTRKNDEKTLKNLSTVFLNEAHKRSLKLSTFLSAIFKSLNPIENLRMFVDIFHWIWYILVILSLKMPLLFIREIRWAMMKPSSESHHQISCLPLVFQSILELVSIARLVLGTSRAIINEIFMRHVESNQLQTISTCGRKVVAWSEPVNVQLLDRISSVTGASHTDILLTAIVGSIKLYFQQNGQSIPCEVLATARYLSQGALFNSRQTSGIVCLSLPTKTPLFNDDPVEILQVIRKNVKEARKEQRAIYALTAAENFQQIITSLLPSILVKIFLNYLTRRYSLSLTCIDGDILAEDIAMAIYWNPPQGNCNLSLTIHKQHGSNFRLGVMGDAMINPQHTIITKTFPQSLENLESILGVSGRIFTPTTTDSLYPTASPGY